MKLTLLLLQNMMTGRNICKLCVPSLDTRGIYLDNEYTEKLETIYFATESIPIVRQHTYGENHILKIVLYSPGKRISIPQMDTLPYNIFQPV